VIVCSIGKIKKKMKKLLAFTAIIYLVLAVKYFLTSGDYHFYLIISMLSLILAFLADIRDKLN